MLTAKKAKVPYRTLHLSRFRRRGRTEAEAFAAAVQAANDRDHILVFTERWWNAEVDRWTANTHGIVIQQGTLFFLNGVEPRTHLHHDDPGHAPYPDEGVPQQPLNKFFYLNGRALYEGPYDEWRHHRQGIALRIGKEYRIVVAKPFDSDKVIC